MVDAEVSDYKLSVGLQLTTDSFYFHKSGINSLIAKILHRTLIFDNQIDSWNHWKLKPLPHIVRTSNFVLGREERLGNARARAKTKMSAPLFFSG